MIDPVTKAVWKAGYYSYINGEWVYLSAYVSSTPVHQAYKDNHPVYWRYGMNAWRQMIVPGRWRPLEGEPKPLQMMRLVGAI